MTTLPAFFDLSARVALIVGGTEAAIDRARLLHETAAAIRLVAPAPNAALEVLLRERAFDWRRRALSPLDLYDVALAFVATGSRADDEAAARASRAARVPVSVFDRPDLSDFFVPALQANVARFRAVNPIAAFTQVASAPAFWRAG